MIIALYSAYRIFIGAKQPAPDSPEGKKTVAGLCLTVIQSDT